MINKKILITGVCGFVGFNIANKLLLLGHEIHGIDSMNNYYDVNLKESRKDILHAYKKFRFIKSDISLIDYDELDSNYDYVLHFAAQAGVRYSFVNTDSYFNSNIIGHYRILKFCKKNNLNLIYASSSSVYGDTKDHNISEEKLGLDQISFYALTKKFNEDLSELFHKSFKFNSIGLRLFTVYGPFGRPDMAYWKFTKKILNNELLEIYGSLEYRRDFTYIDDLVQCVELLISEKDIDKSHQIYNISSSHNRSLGDMISILESLIGKKASIKLSDHQIGDVQITSGNNKKFYEDYGFAPQINLETGLEKFFSWYKKYYDL